MHVHNTDMFVAEFERENLELRAGMKEQDMLHDRSPHKAAHTVA
jgi:hypothetical protein